MNPTSFELLRTTPIFETLNRDDLVLVQQRLIELQFEPGDILFKEGVPGRYVCFVVAGNLDVLKERAGREVVIATLGPGNSVGEMSIIDGLTCSATVRAQTPTTVMALTRDDFDRVLNEHPRVGAEIYKGISRLLSMSLRRTSDDLAALKAAAGP